MTHDTKKALLAQARSALSASNARAFDGDDNFAKVLTIRTCTVGKATTSDDGGFVFEAKVPRSAVNDLMVSEVWVTETPEEAASFLRELADLIEKGTSCS